MVPARRCSMRSSPVHRRQAPSNVMSVAASSLAPGSSSGSARSCGHRRGFDPSQSHLQEEIGNSVVNAFGPHTASVLGTAGEAAVALLHTHLAVWIVGGLRVAG